MKNLYITCCALVMGITVRAQIDPPCGIPDAYLCDNFDAYTAGDALGPGASWWTTWSGTEGGAEDGIITDAYAYSGTNAMLVPGGGVADIILKLGNQSSGMWRLEWMCYLPDGATGYYNIQESEVPGIAWNLEVLFGLYDYTTPAPSGEGVILVPAEENFVYPVATWFRVENLVNMDDNTITVLMDGAVVFEGEFTGNIGAVDFYSIDANVEMYIDDVLFIEEILNTYYEDADADTYGNALSSISVAGPAPVGYVSDDTDCDDTNAAVYPGATEVFNGVDDDCDGQTDEGTVDIATETTEAFSVYPVPADAFLQVQLPEFNAAQNAFLSIVNTTGQIAMHKQIQGSTTLNLDISALPSGMYLVALLRDDVVITRQILIE